MSRPAAAARTCTATGSACAAPGRRRARRRPCRPRTAARPESGTPRRPGRPRAPARRPAGTRPAGVRDTARLGSGLADLGHGRRRPAWRARPASRPTGGTASAYAASSSPADIPACTTALATSGDGASWWSTAARSVTSSMVSSGRPRSSSAFSGSVSMPADHVVGEIADEAAGERRQARAAAGRGQRPPRRAEYLERIAVGRHAGPGSAPLHTASPARVDSVATALTPTNDQRENDRPGSADSSRNVPGRSAASLR